MILIFSPQSSGMSTGTLTLTSTATESATNVSLAGTGTPVLQHSVTLSWDPVTSGGVVGYNVYRGARSGGPYSRINPAVDSTTTDADNTVSAGQTYYYVVTAVDSNSQESVYSNETSAVIPVP
jgi:fibronectin type 3 domain-containing protein